MITLNLAPPTTPNTNQKALSFKGGTKAFTTALQANPLTADEFQKISKT